MKIVSVFGTRPEWVKLAELCHLLEKSHRHVMVHTGQHYDPGLNEQIRRDLGVKRAKYQLRMGSGSFGEQLGRILPPLEKILAKERPDLVLVQGDTNSTLAGALAAARANIPVAHVESGARSGNMRSPEEQNRLMIDAIAALHFAADKDARDHLVREGVRGAILVGNTGSDAVARIASRVSDEAPRSYGLTPGRYGLATLHRAENTATPEVLRERLAVLGAVARTMPVLLSTHPRTVKVLKKFRMKLPPGVIMAGVFGYAEFISLLKNCRVVLSDSGGIQEEAAILKRPCLILREETEWIRLVDAGRNFLTPRLDRKTAVLIDNLLTDDKFYRRVQNRRAPGTFVGASRNIVKYLKRWELRQ